jgi:hypothetical protein
MKMKVILLLLALAAAVFAKAKGEQILSDTEFFSKDYADAVKPILKMAGGNTTVRLTVPQPQPKIEAIQKKYGKPSKVTEEPAAETITSPVRVHYYGSIGFAVAIGDSEGKVAWLVGR